MTRREMESWPVGEPFALRPHTQRITLAVIMRAVFGVHDEARLARFERLIDDFARRVGVITSFPFLRRDLGRCSPWGRFLRSREALDEFIYEEIRLRRAEPGHEERDDVLSLLLGARDEDGEPMSDQRTARRAGHRARRRPRDDRDRARLGGRAAGPQPRGAGEAARLARRRRGGLPRRDGQRDAAGAAGDRRRRPQAEGAGDDRRLRAAGRAPSSCRRSPPCTTARTSSPTPEEFRPERFLDGKADNYAWIPFGGGVRRCIGAAFAEYEMRTILREFVERAELRAADPKPERVKVRNITLAPAKGTRVVLERPLA